MKKKLTIAALLAALLLTGCSNGSDSSGSSGSSANSGSSDSSGSAETLSAAEKAEKLLAEVEFGGEMIEVEKDNMEFQLGFTADELTDYAAYVCGSGAVPDEFGVFTAASEDAAKEIKAALENRIEKQKSTYEDYTPDEVYKFDDCFVKQNGCLVYYAVTADNSKAEEILG